MFISLLFFFFEALKPNAQKSLSTILIIKKLSRNDLKTVKAGEKRTFFVETSCRVSAMTTRDWTYQQVDEWEAKLEANYCKKPFYSGSDVEHLA